MYRDGMATARPLFGRALSEGIAAVPYARAPLREFFDHVEAVPDRVDWDKIRRAERVMSLSGRDALYLARDMSFLGGYLASGLQQNPLWRRMVRSRAGAVRRKSLR